MSSGTEVLVDRALVWCLHLKQEAAVGKKGREEKYTNLLLFGRRRRWRRRQFFNDDIITDARLHLKNILLKKRQYIDFTY